MHVSHDRNGNPDGWDDTCGADNQECSYWWGNRHLKHNYNTGNTGGGKAFSIMPPYYRVYCWRRTELA